MLFCPSELEGQLCAFRMALVRMGWMVIVYLVAIVYATVYPVAIVLPTFNY